MNYVNSKPVCECGSKKIVSGSQKYTTKGEWCTLAERRADPNIKLADAYPYVWVADPTWYYCGGCEKEFDPKWAEEQIAEMMGGKSLHEIPFVENLGIGVTNSVKKLQKFTKE